MSDILDGSNRIHTTDIIQKIWEYFPYAKPEKAQYRMIHTLATTDTGKKILVHNSTGAGKTISALTGLLARKTDDQKIIVFCRTISQLSSFLREWKKILGNDKKLVSEKIISKSVPLIVPIHGKAKMCRVIHEAEFSEYPKDAVGLLCHLLPCKYHISRVKKKPKGDGHIVINNVKLWLNPTPDFFRKNMFSVKNQCPYYYQNAMIRAADIVLVTYPFMQNPLFGNLLKQMNINISQLLMVVDEAHNLSDIDKLSIDKHTLLTAKRIIGANVLLNKLLELLGTPRTVQLEDLGLEYLWEELEQILSVTATTDLQYSLKDLSDPAIITLKRFLSLRSISYLTVHHDTLTFIRISPEKFLKHFDGAALQVYMSGTFQPLPAFRNLFGFDEKDTVLLESENMYANNTFKSFMDYQGMTTKLSKRSPQVFTSMAITILDLFAVSPRHTLVICPSYQLLDEIYTRTQKRATQLGLNSDEFIREQPRMALNDLQKELNYKSSKALIFGVSSGKFSEGIEIVRNGQSLISMLIFAGLPFKQPEEHSNLVNMVRSSTIGNRQTAKHFDQLIPLTQTLTQALGRTVRTHTDIGSLIILDYRAEMFRKHHQSFALRKYTHPQKLLRNLQQFFEGYNTLEEILPSFGTIDRSITFRSDIYYLNQVNSRY